MLLSVAGGGDRQPVIAVASILDERGHDVTFLCDEVSGDLVSGTGIPTLSNDVPQVGYISGWIRQLAEVESPPNPLVEWGTLAAGSVGGLATDWRPDLIVSSLFCMGLADRLASRMGVPWCFVNPAFYFGEGSQTDWVDDWHGPHIPRLAEECFLPLVEKADLVLHAVDPIFDPAPAQLPSSHHYVGFLLWEPSTDIPDVITKPGDPWALVSASTSRPGDEATMLDAAVQGLADHPVRTILTAPKGGITGDTSSKATVVGYVSHAQVLKRSLISVNQASAGIVSKCLTYAVPMVLLPWDADQPGVAYRATTLGVATTIPREQIAPRAVSAAVHQTLNDPSYQARSTEIAAELATRQPAETAAHHIEQL